MLENHNIHHEEQDYAAEEARVAVLPDKDATRVHHEQRVTMETVGVIEQVSSKNAQDSACFKLILFVLSFSAIIGGLFLLHAFSLEGKSDLGSREAGGVRGQTRTRDRNYEERDMEMRSNFDKNSLAESQENRKKVFAYYLERLNKNYWKSKITWDVRSKGSWVQKVKQSLENHENKLIRHLYQSFEKMTSAEIAIFMYSTMEFRSTIRGNKARFIDVFHGLSDEKRWYLQSMTVIFAQRMYFFIVNDESMRKYLSHRGVRRQLTGVNSGWGTVAIHEHSTYHGKDSGKPYWQFILDTVEPPFGRITNIQHYSTKEKGTQNSTINTTNTDSQGKGSHSFTDGSVWETTLSKGMMKIVDAGILDL